MLIHTFIKKTDIIIVQTNSMKKIISKLRSKNYKISTPRVGENREMIAVDISNEKLEFSKSQLSKKILDIQLEVVEIDSELVPVIAFSNTGGRVGYGGGFYDEWFEKIPKPFRIGLAYSFLQFDDIIFEYHDASSSVPGLIVSATIFRGGQVSLLSLFVFRS